jgi:hypothetical protein
MSIFITQTVLLILAFATAFVLSTPIVNTKYGKIAGITKNNVNAFLGIPYAEPPVNNLR